jgi:hypothetical protein
MDQGRHGYERGFAHGSAQNAGIASETDGNDVSEREERTPYLR